MTSNGRLSPRRFNKSDPCPICGGYPGLPRGRGVRCAGMSFGSVAYCTREELAGRLPLVITTSPPSYRHWLFGSCDCGQEHAPSLWRPPSLSPPRRHEDDRPEYPTIEERHSAYSRALELLPLRAETVADLVRRGLHMDRIDEWGFRSLPRRGREHVAFMGSMADEFGTEFLLRCPGFHDKNGRPMFWTAYGGRDGYVVPYRDELGRITGLQAKLLGASYLTPAGARFAQIYAVAGDVRPGGDLYVTEGGTKTVTAAALGGVCCFGVPGQALMPEHVKAICGLAPGRVIVALDRELNIYTDAARERWLECVAGSGIPTFDAVWDVLG